MSGLIAFINEHIDGMEDNETKAAVMVFYRNTLDHIRRKQKEAASAEKYLQIALDGCKV